MASIDFAEIKGRVTELQAADMLGLKLKKSGAATWRGHCPICNNKNQRALAVTPGKGWYCHGDCKAERQKPTKFLEKQKTLNLSGAVQGSGAMLRSRGLLCKPMFLFSHRTAWT